MTAELQRFTSGNWYADVMRRSRLREPPGAFTEAADTLFTNEAKLRRRKAVKKLNNLRGGESKFGRQINPSNWLINPFLQRKPGETAEQYRERLEPLSDFIMENVALHKEALAAWDIIWPLIQLEGFLHDELWKRRNEEMFKALPTVMRYRDALRRYEANNPAAAVIALEFDQTLTKVRDTLREILLRRLFSGELTEEVKTEIMALLQADADSGWWADPEGDIDRIAAEVA